MMQMVCYVDCKHAHSFNGLYCVEQSFTAYRPYLLWFLFMKIMKIQKWSLIILGRVAPVSAKRNLKNLGLRALYLGVIEEIVPGKSRKKFKFKK